MAGLPAGLPAWAGLEHDPALARQALALLADAPSHGLQAQDYGVAALARSLDAGAAGAPLEAALLRYLHDLHAGRIDPRRIHPELPPLRRGPFDAAATLKRALDSARLADAVAAAVPQVPLYEQLRAALAECRRLGAHPAWASPLPPLPRSGKADAAWPGWALVQGRLQAWGDAPAEDGGGGAGLQAALAAFQRRHGLAVDGVLGRASWDALQVRPLSRARQIELMLERLRWTPLWLGPRMIVVNIPEYVLRAYEVVDGHIRVQLTMKVVVGKAAATRTPLISEDLRSIEFSPLWNLPLSIVRNELAPRLQRDLAHWAREGYEFVGPGGRVETALSADRLAAVLAGSGWRIRQRPGPRNALGGIKFVFPNRQAIYLHHTPAVALFERARRDFSHGCIRIEQPAALAQWVLRDQPGWDAARIGAAMAAGKSSTLALDAAIPVLIAYGTALVKDGRMHFHDDVYGLDRRLDAALRALRPAETPPR